MINNAEFYGGKQHEILFLENILAVLYRTLERGPQKETREPLEVPSWHQQRIDGIRQEMMI